MENINENVGQIVKELRKRNNLSVSKLASMLFLDESTIKKYESGKRAVSIEILTKILELLNGELRFTGKSILLEKEDETMSKMECQERKYENILKSFIDFNLYSFKSELEEEFKKIKEKNQERYCKVYELLKEQGIEIVYDYNFNPDYVLADAYSTEELIRLEMKISNPLLKNNNLKEITENYAEDTISLLLTSEGRTTIEFFQMDEFINSIKKSDLVAGVYIEKALVFYGKEGYGFDLFTILKNNNMKELKENYVLLQPYIQIIESELLSNNYFYEQEEVLVQNEYMPLSYHVGIFNVSNVAYPLFVCIMPDGTEIPCESSCEDMDIVTCLGFAKSYFSEDYISTYNDWK